MTGRYASERAIHVSPLRTVVARSELTHGVLVMALQNVFYVCASPRAPSCLFCFF